MPLGLLDPEEWLRRARSNLARAALVDVRDVLLEDLCFDAQQAVEKALKALLVSRGLPPPRTHSISELLTLVGTLTPIPPELREAAGLTVYAVQTRYPGASESVSAVEHAEALRMAVLVVAWVRQRVEPPSGPWSQIREADVIVCTFRDPMEGGDVPADFPGRRGREVQVSLDLQMASVRGWPEGRSEDLYVKVVDTGNYRLYAGHTLIAEIDGDYVPDCIPGEFGDYLILKIAPDGGLIGWTPDPAAIARDFRLNDD